MNTPATTASFPAQSPPPAGVRIALLVISAGFLCTVLAGLWLALVASGQVLWTTVGFEVVALGAGVAGVLGGLGKIREGFGLGLLCVAGAVLVTGVFGLHFTAGPTLNSAIQSGEVPASTGRVLAAIVKARVLVGGLMALLAALAVLSRNAASWKPLGLGFTLLVPVVAIGVWMIRFGGAERLVGEIETGLGVARLIGVLFLGLVLCVIASVGGHFIIRAFEKTAPEEPGSEAPAAKTATTNAAG